MDEQELTRRLRLYLVTDRRLSQGRGEEEVVTAALAGGVTAVQLRGKEMTTRQLVAVGERLREITRRVGALFLVNDRLDVALAVEADGVHLGQDDLPLDRVRRLAGRRFLIGISAENPREAQEAEAGGADYIGAGAVFPTGTKADAGHPIGLEGLAAIVASVKIPVVAIGGINAANAATVLKTGAAGIAVVSAIVAAPDVTAAAAELRHLLGEY
ncbi:MAG: thiamine phosphate synthase [Firmicutes bacterium]|nr:thiamine phosphate synthase [Bacillota bacterium]MCL5039038.1 thiamine phosphate synthase [Bacillota bacterium]